MGPSTLELGRTCLLGLGEGGPASADPSAASSVEASGVLLTDGNALVPALHTPDQSAGHFRRPKLARHGTL